MRAEEEEEEEEAMGGDCRRGGTKKADKDDDDGVVVADAAAADVADAAIAAVAIVMRGLGCVKKRGDKGLIWSTPLLPAKLNRSRLVQLDAMDRIDALVKSGQSSILRHVRFVELFFFCR